MSSRNAITVVVLLAALFIGALWLWPRPGEPSKTAAAPAPGTPNGGAKLVVAPPTVPAAVTRAAFRSKQAGGQASVSCATCEASECHDLVSTCDNVSGNAKAGPAAGKPKGDLCRELVTCVRESGCGTRQLIDCVCGTADAMDCNEGKSNGQCLGAFQAALETNDAHALLERTSDASYAGGAASSLLMCDQDACRKDCVPYYR